MSKANEELRKKVYNPYLAEHDPKSNICPCCVYDEAANDVLDLFQSEVEAAEKRSYEQALNDFFKAVASLAEPDERGFGAGDLVTNMDVVHEKRKELESKFLTTPER